MRKLPRFGLAVARIVAAGKATSSRAAPRRTLGGAAGLALSLSPAVFFRAVSSHNRTTFLLPQAIYSCELLYAPWSHNA